MAKTDGSPLVSVVLPTYGRPEFLTDAVESVLEQTYDRIELLVVDDCSPEPVAPALAGIDAGEATMRVIRHEENQGANGARNTGIREASGEFVAFIDDDDLWEPTKLERQVAAVDSEAVGVVYTGMRYVVDGETSHVIEADLEGEVTRELLTGAEMGTFSTLMVRQSAIEAAGLPDERFPCWQDREWPIRLSQHCEFAAVPEPLTVHRIDDHEQISDDFETKRDVAYPLFIETFRPLAEEFGSRAVDEMIAFRARVVAASALQTGHYEDARRFALRAVRADPLDRKALLFLVLSLGGRPLFTAAQRAKRRALRLTR